MSHASILATALALLAASGIALAQDARPSPLSDLERARARWTAAAIANYEYRFKLGGFVPPPLNQWVRCIVDADGPRTEFVVPVDPARQSGLPGLPGRGPLSNYCGVSVLFDRIELDLKRAQGQPPVGDPLRALWRAPAIAYDAERGFPTRVVIDPAAQSVDDEEIFFVEGFAPR